MTPSLVADGYAALMGRYALPWLCTQTFEDRSHPETVIKAHRHFLNLLNRELHGNHWKRRGITGAQSILGVERHKSGWPHSHAVIGHPDLDIGSAQYNALRRGLKLECDHQWGNSKVEVAKNPLHCNRYVAKYITKDGELEISPDLHSLATGQLSLRMAAQAPPGAAPSSHPTVAHPASASP